MNIVFGYGSLINPLSFSGRRSNYTNIDEIYDNDRRLSDPTDRSGAIETWDTLVEEHGVSMHPVKLSGYKRFYSIKHRGGGMLEIYPEENTFINGVLYTNVPDDIYDSIVSSEEGYTAKEIPIEDFRFYNEVPDDVEGETVYVFEPDAEEPRTDLSRHPVYHDGILKCFVFLLNTDYLENGVVWHLLLDFLATTYEFSEDDGGWKSLLEKDGPRDLDRVSNEYAKEGDTDIY